MSNNSQLRDLRTLLLFGVLFVTIPLWVGVVMICIPFYLAYGWVEGFLKNYGPEDRKWWISTGIGAAVLAVFLIVVAICASVH
jgi:hypothetical protein